MKVFIVLSVDVLPTVTATEFGERVTDGLHRFRTLLGGLVASRVKLVGVRGITRPMTTTIEREIVRCLTREEVPS